MDQSSNRRLATVLHSIVLIGMGAATIGALVTIASPAGLGLLGGPDEPIIETTASVVFEVDFGDRLESRQTDDDVVDAATGLGRAGIGAPVTAQFAFFEPSTAMRVVWVVAQLLGPILVFAGLWLVLGIVRSTRDGHPFTAANERRLWRLSSLVAIGGTLATLAGEFARTLVLQRSAAADMTAIEATFSFLPIAVGLAIAVLAGIWRLGIGMSDDIAGTI